MAKKKFIPRDKCANRLLDFIEVSTGLPKKQIAEKLFITRQLYNAMRKIETHKMQPWRQWHVKYTFGLADDAFLRLTHVSQKVVAEKSAGYHLETDVGAQSENAD